LYAVWVRIDETLPWIELKKTYETRKEAKEAAENFRSNMQMKIVAIEEDRKLMKAVATVRI
jgi:hypothetical protein